MEILIITKLRVW